MAAADAAHTYNDYPEFLAALSILFGLPPGEARPSSSSGSERLSADLAETRAELAAIPPDLPRLFLLEEEYRIALLSAEVSFLSGVIEDLKAGRLTWSEEWLRQVATRFITCRRSRGVAMTAIIEAHGLIKRYGKTRALDGLDLVAHSGQVVAVLGPNGAGKTTFVRSVATLLRPDEGSLHVAGHDVRREPAAVRRVIGLAGQFAAIEPAMTGRENLEMVARLFGRNGREAKAAAASVLEQLGLVDRRRSPRADLLGRHAPPP